MSFVNAELIVDDCHGLTAGTQTARCNGENYCYRGACCGDGAGEKYIFQKMGNCDMASDIPLNGKCVTSEDTGCMFAIPSGTKPSDPETGEVCWLPNQAQTYNHLVYYYNPGELMGSNTPYFDIYSHVWRNFSANWYSCVCENNVWVEAGDSRQELCEAGAGIAKTLTFLNPVPQNVWMDDFCCGDDCFEHHIVGEDETKACCKNSEQIVVKGVCYDDISDVEVEIAEAPENSNVEQEVEVKTKVKNKGVHEEEVDVEFSVEDEEENVIHEETKTINLKMGETKNVNFVWKAIEGVYKFFVRVDIEGDENSSDNEDSSQIEVSGVVYLCSDSDGGLDYFNTGKASLQVSSTRIRSYKDSCKNNPTDFLGDFDNNIGPGGGPVVYDKVTPYLYEAICQNGKPTMKLHNCDCLNGKCI